MERMSRDPDVVRKLAQSLAPGVYGHLDVKKSVLLMLMGGVHKQTLEVTWTCPRPCPPSLNTIEVTWTWPTPMPICTQHHPHPDAHA